MTNICILNRIHHRFRCCNGIMSKIQLILRMDLQNNLRYLPDIFRFMINANGNLRPVPLDRLFCAFQSSTFSAFQIHLYKCYRLPIRQYRIQTIYVNRVAPHTFNFRSAPGASLKKHLLFAIP